MRIRKGEKRGIGERIIVNGEHTMADKGRTPFVVTAEEYNKAYSPIKPPSGLVKRIISIF